MKAKLIWILGVGTCLGVLGAPLANAQTKVNNWCDTSLQNFNEERYVEPSAPNAGDRFGTIQNDCSQVPCVTIQHAVNQAANGDIIYVEPGTYAGTVTITNKSVHIVNASVVRKTGKGDVILDGAGRRRLFEIQGSVNAATNLRHGVCLQGLTVRNGFVAPGNNSKGGAIISTTADLKIFGGSISTSVAEEGGGLSLANGTLYTEGVKFENNRASTSGGAISANGPSVNIDIVSSQFLNNNGYFHGGALKIKGHEVTRELAKLKITDSTFIANTCGEQGGAINLDLTDASINQTTLSENQADSSGGGISTLDSKLTVNNSTLARNKASGTVSSSSTSGFGGGIYARAANGETLPQNSLTVNQSTLSANEAPKGAGIASFVKANINSSTIAFNLGLGIQDYNQRSVPTQVQNTIIAKNTGGQCASVLASLDFNLAEDASCFNGANDKIGDPRLAPLSLQGGLTPVHAIDRSSPAFDSGNTLGCNAGAGIPLCSPYVAGACPASNLNDQRGKGFPRKSAVNCDIGAFEFVSK